MSYEAEKWARSQKTGNARAKQVLIELANCFNSDSGLCCPSIAYLCEVTELTESTVLKATKHLVSLGLISKKIVSTSTGRGCVYTLNFGDEHTPKFEGTDTHKNEDTPNFEDTPKIDMTDTPKFEGTDTPKFKGVTSKYNKEIEQVNKKEKKEKEKEKRVSLIRPDDGTEDVFSEWVGFKKKISSLCTQRMINAIVRESKKAGITTEEAMIYQMEKGWKGFTSEWYLNDTNKKCVRTRVKQPEKDFTNVSIPNGGGSIKDVFGF